MKQLVSIPNGMEFYVISFWLSRQYNLFQFPTGWNSTLFRPHQNLENTVSIPNGMEFYWCIAMSSDYLNICFNSQRDGILLYTILGFSFPNYSFNSQRDGILLTLGSLILLFIICFNSQRDGILLKVNASSGKVSGFQFPTGWNSTV